MYFSTGRDQRSKRSDRFKGTLGGSRKGCFGKILTTESGFIEVRKLSSNNKHMQAKKNVGEARNKRSSLNFLGNSSQTKCYVKDGESQRFGKVKMDRSVGKTFE